MSDFSAFTSATEILQSEKSTICFRRSLCFSPLDDAISPPRPLSFSLPPLHLLRLRPRPLRPRMKL